MRILLFEDIPDNRRQVKAALTNALQGRGEVQEFVEAASGVREGTYEERLIKDLKSAPNTDVQLIIADRDLSGYRDEFRGLSEDTVRRVADVIGVPECGYARGESAGDDEYIKRGERREACIRLSFKPNIDQFGQRAIAIAEGFAEIEKRLRLIPDATKLPPGKLLAQVLEKPEYAEKIALYSSGDENRLNVLRSGDPTERIQRLSCLLGYWLWDSVLRFPGVTVGVIPASSYLNIEQGYFEENEEVRELFSPAVYSGPFASAKVKMWWRGMLDDIVADNDCNDGRDYAAKKLNREIPPSQCCEDSSHPAGYYCMLTERPVSIGNSKGGLPWFPRGADLARVSSKKLDELGPWL